MHTSLFAWALAVAATALQAATPAAQPPHLEASGETAYAAYRQAAGHKAFAVAPGGTWAWRAELPTPAMARDSALADCRQHTVQGCFVYALDNEVVFDDAGWRQAWGPYLDRSQAARAASGTGRGERFPDLALTAPGGRRMQLSDLRGRVVVLHFWGSWCPPCQKEMPDLQRLYGELFKSRDITFVLLPVREPYARAQEWARQRKVRMPIYDGGPTVAQENAFRLDGGGTLADRQVARVFPTTYVLDKHGVVLFSHVGPVSRWSEYAPLLRDAASRSGR